jgi:hypothetical protein
MSALFSTVGRVAYIVGSVIDVNDVPVLSSELGRSVVGETSVDRSVNSDVVVIIDQDQIVETPMSS